MDMKTRNSHKLGDLGTHLHSVWAGHSHGRQPWNGGCGHGPVKKFKHQGAQAIKGTGVGGPSLYDKKPAP